MASPRPVPDRCRIVLVLPEDLKAEDAPKAVSNAFEGGDIASVIVPPHRMGERAYSDHLKRLAPIVQPRGAALVACRDTRLANRVKADGVHLNDGQLEPGELDDVIEHVGRRMSVGVEAPRTRDRALELGERGVDYVMFGAVGGDTHEEPYGKNLDLAEWWAAVIQIPCIVMAGLDLDGTVECAETGAEFVALSRAVFADPARTREMVSRANAMLDQNAPSFRMERRA